MCSLTPTYSFQPFSASKEGYKATFSQLFFCLTRARATSFAAVSVLFRLSLAKMGRRSKSKRAGFRGTPSYAKKAAAGSSRSEPDVAGVAGNHDERNEQPSAAGASAKKLANAPLSWARIGHTTAPREDGLTAISNTHPPTYRLIDMRQLIVAILSFLVCRSCKKGRISLLEDEKERKGFASKIVMSCDECSASHSFFTSGLRPGTRGHSFDVNRRTALAAVGTGSNRAGFVRFAGVMNMPAPPLYDSWDQHMEGLSDVLGMVGKL